MAYAFAVLVPIQEKEFSHEDRLTVREAILKVPEEQRAVLILSYYHDMQKRNCRGIRYSSRNGEVETS